MVGRTFRLVIDEQDDYLGSLPEDDPRVRRRKAMDALTRVCMRLVDEIHAAADVLLPVFLDKWYRHEGATCLADACRRRGVPDSLARALQDVVRAMAEDERVAPVLRTRTIPLDAAATLGQIAGCPEAVRAAEPWFDLAKTMDWRNFRRFFEKRRAEIQAGQPVCDYNAKVTYSGKAKLDQCQTLMARKAHGNVLRGEMLEALANDWLDRNDPTWTEEGTRRLPDTSTIPGSRTVPAEVDRAIRRRNDDCCPVPFCTRRIYMDSCHIIPHRDGGSREARNLVRMCDDHNWLQEDGYLIVEGTADAPVFKDRFGRLMEEYGPWSPPPPGVPDPLKAGKPPETCVPRDAAGEPPAVPPAVNASPPPDARPPPAPPPAETSPPLDAGPPPGPAP